VPGSAYPYRFRKTPDPPTRTTVLVHPTYPHPDPMVLHRPGLCGACDQHPEWQALRRCWQVAFTGEDPTADQTECPAERRRGRPAVIHTSGNQPGPPHPVTAAPEAKRTEMSEWAAPSQDEIDRSRRFVQAMRDRLQQR
jgi:hypothetical protein